MQLGQAHVTPQLHPLKAVPGVSCAQVAHYLQCISYMIGHQVSLRSVALIAPASVVCVLPAGTCYRLWPGRMWSRLSPQQPPEVLRVPLQQLCLTTKAALAAADLGQGGGRQLQGQAVNAMMAEAAWIMTQAEYLPCCASCNGCSLSISHKILQVTMHVPCSC